MGKIAIITDSNSGITIEQAKELGIHILPMPFFINGEIFFEGLTLTQDEFYRKLNEDADISTSQPSPGDVTKLWDDLLKEYDSVIHIPMSSGLSGSCSTAKMLAEDYDGKVFVVDNKRISVTQRQSVLDAIMLRDKGLSVAEIHEILEKEAHEASIYVAVDTLKYLKKGGRITPAAAAIGGILKIKPILQIQGDKLDSFAKARGMKQAEKIMVEAIKKDRDERFKGHEVYIHVAYSGEEKIGQKWREKIQEEFPEMEIYMDPLSLSVACHTGDGALGIVCIKKLS